ncbi:MAG TPA: methylated-DNA--[protein]-cysteine S-methyltransferase [Candidatus Binataceae bacterium]|nr:methylated-DNA--[protein]-cysteine S-methyltransferase [Candidatus Binataceae bacterium]
MEHKIEHYFENGMGPSDRLVEELVRKARPRLERALERIRRPLARVALVESGVGRLLAAHSARGLVALRFIDSDDISELLATIRQRFEVAEDAALADEIGGEIERLLQGDVDAIAHRAIDLSLVESDFQRRALNRLRRVPAGSVVTYQALAAAIGSPSSQRAIGNTVASNPVPIYVPCHRVIRSDGSIGNYGGGPERKLKLLRAEGFGVDRQRRVPADAVYGHWVSRIFCRPTCSAVRRSDRRKWIIFADPAHARGFGMRACKLCRPA